MGDDRTTLRSQGVERDPADGAIDSATQLDGPRNFARALADSQ